ncbi:MAG: site-specific DNA-methyltransferase, partial [Chloroflexi bacterium]|nr:site-specific DNA-methyltransferase [Chloroflexota bacterium]
MSSEPPRKPCIQQSSLDEVAIPATSTEWVTFSQTALLQAFDEMAAAHTTAAFRSAARALRESLVQPSANHNGLSHSDDPRDTLRLRCDTLVRQLDQMIEAYTLERAQYYLHRLRAGLVDVRTSAINDINLLRWQEYDDVLTDSLWVIERRDTSGAHLGWYWGNFVPQIPHQLMLRYTKRGEWVLDVFAGSGTALIECRRLGRNGIGFELSEQVVQAARELIDREPNQDGVVSDLLAGDSRTVNIGGALAAQGQCALQLVIMHPPYHDIIPFSDDPRDLSAAPSTETFLT